MKRLFSILLGIFFILLIPPKGATAQGCSAESDWTLNPAPAANNTYDAGTAVEMCVEITSYTSGSGWLQGIEVLLPEGWDQSSLTMISAPEACNSNGVWLFMDTVDCGWISLGPGFYFDSPGGGILDGSPCNNFGDGCPNPTDWQFCFQATLLANCGGPDFPLAHTNIMPTIRLLSDEDMSANPEQPGCGYDLIVQPDLSELTFNCCDAHSGISPGTIYVCGDASYNLYDSLLTPKDAGGVWS